MPHLSYIWMTTICSFYYIYICFMGVDYTHMRSFVIDNSWSYEIILRVWICRSGIPFCRMVFTVTPHELHGLRYVLFIIYICFMGVDYTHMRSFVIDNSWSYEIILRVWICRSGIPFCRMVFTVTPHELHGVTNQRPIYCLFNSMHWLTTKEKSKLSYLKRNLYNKLFPNL